MATSVGALYLQLGLNLSELETGFVTASQTVAANINRLNRESALIRLRSQVQIEGLDEVADAEQIAQIRTNALNRQMAIQRDRCRILEAELRSLTAQHGANAAATQRAAIRLERERLTLAQLETEFNGLNESTSIFQEFQESLPSMPTKLQAIGMSAGAMTAGIGAAAATKELLEEFRELQTQSYELNMSIPDTRNFLRQLKLGGGDIGDFEGYIRGITDAYVKGEYDDPEFIALRKYGAVITDATGRLKDFKDLTDEVYQAWKKAYEAGEGIEFLQLTGGEAGVRDAIQLFKRYEEAKEDAAKIFTADIDDKQLHELDRTLNLVEEQASELKKEFGSLFTPLAQAAGEKFFQLFHDGTEYIAENKDAIQSWGFIAAETFDTIADKISELTSYQMPDTGDKNVDKILDSLQWKMAEANEYALWGDNSPWSKIFSQLPKDIAAETGILERAKERQKEYNDELDETATVAGEVAAGLDELSEAQKKNGDVLSQYGTQRVKQFKDELEDLQIELDFGDNDYLKALAELDLWKRRELTDKNFVSTEEREAIEQLYAAKSAQIEQERADKLQEIRDQINAADKTELENKLDAIEKERQAWLKAGMDEAEAEQLAQQRRVQVRQEAEDKFQEIRDSVAAAEKTSLQNKLDNIEKERQAWLKAGMDEAEAAELAQRKKNQAMQEAHEKAQSYLDEAAAIEFGVTHTAFEKQIYDIERWKAAQIKKAETAEEVAAIVKDAAAKESEAFAREAERIKDLTKSIEEEIFELTHSQYATDKYRAYQKAQKAVDQGVDFATASKYLSTKLKSIEENAGKRGKEYKEGADYSVGKLAPNWRNASPFFDSSTPPDKIKAFPASDELQKLADSSKSVTETQGNLTLSTRELFDAQDSLRDAFVDSLKSVSEMQRSLTLSTKELADAQDSLRNALTNFAKESPVKDKASTKKEEAQDAIRRALDKMPDAVNSFREKQSQSSAESMTRLADSTKDVRQAQDSLTRSVRQTDSEIQRSQIAQKDGGLKLGFDYDTAKGIFLTGAGIAAASAGTGVGLAFTPEILAGAIVAALGGGLIKGTYDESTAKPESNLQTLSEVDLTGVITPLNSIDTNLQSVLQTLQEKPAAEESAITPEIFSPLNNLDTPLTSVIQEWQDNQGYQSDALQESFGELPNIRADVQSILAEMQTRSELDTQPTESIGQDYLPTLINIDGNLQSVLTELQTQSTQETTLPVETIVTPLNNIAGLVQQILSALANRQPPTITVSPSISNNLGGAYVFDNAMKKSLVEDITTQIVSAITSAVQQATSKSNYSYGA